MINEQIEWNLDNASTLSGEEDYLKGDFINEPSLLIKENIRFSDNRWDISDKLHPDVPILDFSTIRSKIFRVLLKKIILRDWFIQRKRKRNQTVYRTYQYIKKFIVYLEKEKYMFKLGYLTPEIINEYIENIKKGKVTKNYLFAQMKMIERFLKEVHFAGHNIDLSDYQKILSIPYPERKAEQEANKIPNIPKRIFKQVIKCALSDIKDDSLRIQERMIACLIVILSHTGMRKGELQRLEADKLRDITILNKKEKAYILEFFTYKTTAAKDGRWTKTIAFPETVIAYQILVELSEERRKIENASYLFLNKYGKRYSRTSFDYLFDAFFYRHQNEIFNNLSDFEKAQVHQTKIGSFLIGQIGLNGPRIPIIGEAIFTLNPHQFRVAVANILKNKVNLQWIREHMNHLDEEMTKHYFRDDDIIKETLFNRASTEGNSLELQPNKQTNLIKNEISEPELLKAYEEINKFLKKKKFNIFKDIDEIINTLKYNPLRESVVGVCTKHIGLLCERQYRLATFEKWYYLSPKVPNIESFDFTYKRFLDKAKIVQHNKSLVQQNLDYQRDYEIEYSALKKFFHNRVLPEHELVNSILNEKGKEILLSSYPQLEGIISNIDDVNKEITEWVSKLILKDT